MKKIINRKILIPAIALCGAFFNWFFRGGGIESALLNYKSVPALKIVSALIFGGVAWYQSGSALVAASAFVGMLIGQAFGWGPYIRAMKGEDPDHSKSWGIMRMTLRGLIWSAFLIPTAVLGHSLATGMGFVLAGLSMGGVYYWAIQHVKSQGKIVNHWTVAEAIFGALIWVPLAFLLRKKKEEPKKESDAPANPVSDER